MNTHSSNVRGIPSPPPPTIVLTGLMGQQACLGSLVSLGMQQGTSSEHLVTLQRWKNQEPSFLKYSFWERTHRVLGQPLGGDDFPPCSCLGWWPQWHLGARVHLSSHRFRFESESASVQLLSSPLLSPPSPQLGSWPQNTRWGWGSSSRLSCQPQAPRRATRLRAPAAVAAGLEEATGLLQLTTPPAGRPDPCCISSPSPSLPPLPLLLLLLLLLLQYFISKDPETVGRKQDEADGTVCSS